MKDLLSKLSSYNLFNNLLPGVLFVLFTRATTKYDLVQDDILLGVFLYYFLGMVVSRFGSLVLDPLLKMVKVLPVNDYGRFIAASKKDEQIGVLSEVNNSYRTLSALLALVALTKGYEQLAALWPTLDTWRMPVLGALLLAVFLAAYRKQYHYVQKRVDHWTLPPGSSDAGAAPDGACARADAPTSKEES